MVDGNRDPRRNGAGRGIKLVWRVKWRTWELRVGFEEHDKRMEDGLKG